MKKVLISMSALVSFCNFSCARRDGSAALSDLEPAPRFLFVGKKFSFKKDITLKKGETSTGLIALNSDNSCAVNLSYLPQKSEFIYTEDGRRALNPGLGEPAPIDLYIAKDKTHFIAGASSNFPSNWAKPDDDKSYVVVCPNNVFDKSKSSRVQNSGASANACSAQLLVNPANNLSSDTKNANFLVWIYVGGISPYGSLNDVKKWENRSEFLSKGKQSPDIKFRDELAEINKMIAQKCTDLVISD